MSATVRVETSSPTIRAALVGNPNAGKTTLFNALTGHRQRVGNYPGTTVEQWAGRLRHGTPGVVVDLWDLPGAYSLAARSADEAIVLNTLGGEQGDAASPDVIVSVVDATNLARHLFLTSQLLELGKPVVVALNMIDLAEAAGMKIDPAVLSEQLGVPVIPVVATARRGIPELARTIEAVFTNPKVGNSPTFPASIDDEISELQRKVLVHNGFNRSEWLQAVLNPEGYQERRIVGRWGRHYESALAQSRERIVAAGESLVEVEARVRYGWIERILKTASQVSPSTRKPASERADRLLTHPVFGLAILLTIMAGCFQALYTWAGPLMDIIDAAFCRIGNTISAFVPEGALQSLLVNGAVAGVGAVLAFLPQIVILFLFIALIEDCGYLARAAFLLDRWMHLLGLNGKAFIPLLSSFACAVPGIMATRVIEDRRDRFVAMLIAPLMSCSARLPVYTLMVGAFIAPKKLVGGLLNLQAVTMLAMYLLGIGVAIPVTWLLKRTLLKGAPQPFLLELPTYRWPSPRTVFFRVFDQAKAFCTSAGTMIFAVTVLIWALGYYPHPASIARDHERQRAEVRSTAAASGLGEPSVQLAEIDRNEAGTYLRQSILGRMGAVIEPAVAPLGWDWRIGTAAIASFPAREVVIATLGTLYNLGSDTDENSAGLRQQLAAATRPDGRPVYNTAVALSIMVFFALCCQCGATLAAIRRETQSWRWPIFTFSYMTGLAYVAALITYQVAVRFV